MVQLEKLSSLNENSLRSYDLIENEERYEERLVTDNLVTQKNMFSNENRCLRAS